MVTRSPRGRAFEDILIQSCECKNQKTEVFFGFLFLDLLELDAKLL